MKKYIFFILCLFILPSFIFASDSDNMFAFNIHSMASIIGFEKKSTAQISIDNVKRNLDGNVVAVNIATFCVRSTGDEGSFKLKADPVGENVYTGQNAQKFFFLRKIENGSIADDSDKIKVRLVLFKDGHTSKIITDQYTDLAGYNLDGNDCNRANALTLKVRIQPYAIKSSGTYQLAFNLEALPFEG